MIKYLLVIWISSFTFLTGQQLRSENHGPHHIAVVGSGPVVPIPNKSVPISEKNGLQKEPCPQAARRMETPNIPSDDPWLSAYKWPSVVPSRRENVDNALLIPRESPQYRRQRLQVPTELENGRQSPYVAVPAPNPPLPYDELRHDYAPRQIPLHPEYTQQLKNSAERLDEPNSPQASFSLTPYDDGSSNNLQSSQRIYIDDDEWQSQRSAPQRPQVFESLSQPPSSGQRDQNPTYGNYPHSRRSDSHEAIVPGSVDSKDKALGHDPQPLKGTSNQARQTPKSSEDKVSSTEITQQNYLDCNLRTVPKSRPQTASLFPKESSSRRFMPGELPQSHPYYESPDANNYPLMGGSIPEEKPTRRAKTGPPIADTAKKATPAPVTTSTGKGVTATNDIVVEKKAIHDGSRNNEIAEDRMSPTELESQLMEPAKGVGIVKLTDTNLAVIDSTRVCYACSSTSDPSCWSPERRTTVKYCARGRDACVTKTYKGLSDALVVIRDCSTACDEVVPVLGKKYESCSICGADLCNSLYVDSNGSCALCSTSVMVIFIASWLAKYYFY